MSRESFQNFAFLFFFFCCFRRLHWFGNNKNWQHSVFRRRLYLSAGINLEYFKYDFIVKNLNTMLLMFYRVSTDEEWHLNIRIQRIFSTLNVSFLFFCRCRAICINFKYLKRYFNISFSFFIFYLRVFFSSPRL